MTPEKKQTGKGSTVQLQVLYLLLLVLFTTTAAPAADSHRTPKELIQYVEDAKNLGLNEDEIRRNAIAAGWNKDKVGEALAIVRFLGESSTRPAATGQEGPKKPTTEPDGYRIGPGDVLQIVVWKEPEASVPNVVVRADGKITVPLVKEIEVGGMTPTEVEKLLTEKLEQKFIRGADVTVVPKEINSMKAYLVGQVKKEGPLSIQSSMTVLQALNAAGGLTDFAKRKKIYVLRNDNGKQIRLPFDYEAVLRGERAELNVVLKPEDTIVVP